MKTTTPEKKEKLKMLFDSISEDTGKYVNKTVLGNFDPKNPKNKRKIKLSSQVYMVPFSFDLWKKIDKEIFDDDGNLVEVKTEYLDSYSEYPAHYTQNQLGGNPTRETVNWLIPTSNKVKDIPDLFLLFSNYRKDWINKLKENDSNLENLQVEKRNKRLEMLRNLSEDTETKPTEIVEQTNIENETIPETIGIISKIRKFLNI